MRVQRTGPFRRDFQALPLQIQNRAEKALEFLLTNLRHPSLRTRIVDQKRRIWKANVNGGYRFTFRIEGDLYILRRIGSHQEMLRPERW